MSSSGIDKVLILFDKIGNDEILKQSILCGLKHPHVIKESYLNKEGLKLVKEGDYGLLVISSDLRNELSISVASFATLHPTATIIYIADDTYFLKDEEIRNKDTLLDIGATLLVRPFIHNAFMVATNAADMSHIRLCKLKKKLDEEKIIARAKLVLMEVLCMSEEQSHKYIERESMNSGLTKVQTAYDILRTYDY